MLPFFLILPFLAGVALQQQGQKMQSIKFVVLKVTAEVLQVRISAIFTKKIYLDTLEIVVVWIYHTGALQV